MEYKIYKFNFTAGVHFGESSLEDGGFTLCADTLFSALCQERLKQGAQELEELIARTRAGRLWLTDAFPYIGNTYYLPKPMLRIETEDQQGDSVLKKAYKKLSYVPADKLKEYLAGELDVIQEYNRFRENLGHREIKTSAAVRGLEETKPYRVGIYRFLPGNGLYIIAAGEEEEDIQLLEEVLVSLELSGIGGKRSAGLGRYQLEQEHVPEELKCRFSCGQPSAGRKILSQRLGNCSDFSICEDLRKREEENALSKCPKGDTDSFLGENLRKRKESILPQCQERQAGPVFMALSVCLPREEELEEALEQANYLLLKRSGFVASETYAKEQLRKRDLYVMQAGSCFRKQFAGDVYDVSDGGSHPVYRYAKPLFLEVMS